MTLALTPVMRQYARSKAEHPEALLFFRMGDFYELFHDDAKEVSRLLQLTLTARGDGIPMAGVPVRAAQTYLRRLLDMGRSVAICEQLEDPKLAKGIVDRGIVRVLTPGTLTEDGDLDATRNNYLLAVATSGPATRAALPHSGPTVGLAWVDLSTGAFEVAELSDPAPLADELARLDPSEILASRELLARHPQVLDAVQGAARREPRDIPDWWFDEDSSRRALCEHFGVADLGGYGLDGCGAAVAAAGAVLQYLRETQKTALPHLRAPRPFDPGGHLRIDRVSLRCLEITANQQDGSRAGSLLSCVDRTKTAMGARLLRGWLSAPLAQADAIRRRHDAVEELVQDPEARGGLRAALSNVQDLERLLARIATGRAGPRDVVALGRSLASVPGAVASVPSPRSGALRDALLAADPIEELVAEIAATLVDDPPLATNEGGYVRTGRDAALDELRSLSGDAQRYLADLQAREIARTGIPTLRVAYNSVFGYAIEVTRSHLDKVPADYTRRQTLKNVERYVTPELKEWEGKLLSADERARSLEMRLFQAVRQRAADDVRRIQATAAALAELDALASFAEVAADRNWSRPSVGDGPALRIREGRHPVLEGGRAGEPFVPNDAELWSAPEGAAPGGPCVGVLTGPNMAGKSTYIRQVALLVVLAQAGSFVPAASAEIGLADRVFARVGSGDDLAKGRSTFMVEMMETANILHQATARSLVVLDEVGRGTSTYDGVALAWAITEHLATRIGARTLFATHYHELTGLRDTSPELSGRVTNLRVAVRESGDRVVFLRRIEAGGTDRSYGVHVAKLAGLPATVLDRAAEVLRGLESRPRAQPSEAEAPGAAVVRRHPEQRLRRPRSETAEVREPQLPLFAGAAPEPPPHPLVEAVRDLALEDMTPLAAMAWLASRREELRRPSRSQGDS